MKIDVYCTDVNIAIILGRCETFSATFTFHKKICDN